MPWCPKCRNEYRDGMKECAECGCGLVDTEPFPEQYVKLIFGEEEQMKALKKYLEYNGLESALLQYDEEEQVWELLVRENDCKKAARLRQIFLLQESGARAEEEADIEESGAASSQRGSGVYFDSAEKAEDNRSSAWTLLGVGGIGLAVMVLGVAGVLPIRLSGTNKYLIYGTMSALFLLFIVMGIVSLRNSKIFARKAESENSLRDAMSRWCRVNLDGGDIDTELGLTEDLPEEMRYFRRIERMKEKLNHQFVNLDEAFLDHFIDEEYDEVFGGGR